VDEAFRFHPIAGSLASLRSSSSLLVLKLIGVCCFPMSVLTAASKRPKRRREGGGEGERERERESESGELSRTCRASASNLNRQTKKGKRAGKQLSETLLDYLWVHRGEPPSA
jgi:hypothetical protein